MITTYHMWFLIFLEMCTDDKINFCKELRIAYSHYPSYYKLHGLTKSDCYFHWGDLQNHKKVCILGMSN